MKTFTNWQEINMQHPYSEEMPYISVRPGDPRVRQYVEDGKELLAVDTPEPYGVLSRSAISGLLQPAHQGSDYSIFELPQTLIALKALSLGTGNMHPELLHDTYRSVGSTVRRIADEGVDATELKIDDIGVDRQTGEIYVLPPVDFRNNIANTEANYNALTESLADLRSVFPTIDIAHFESDIQRGIQS